MTRPALMPADTPDLDFREIGRTACACRAPDARRCIALRGGDPDERCECGCHEDDEGDDA